MADKRSSWKGTEHNNGASVPLSSYPHIKASGNGCLLSIHVQVKASRTAIAGTYGDKLKIALSAPPVDGKANASLCEFIAKKTGVAKSSIELVSGMTSRDKTLFVPLPPEALSEVLSCGEKGRGAK